MAVAPRVVAPLDFCTLDGGYGSIMENQKVKEVVG